MNDGLNFEKLTGDLKGQNPWTPPAPDNTAPTVTLEVLQHIAPQTDADTYICPADGGWTDPPGMPTDVFPRDAAGRAEMIRQLGPPGFGDRFLEGCVRIIKNSFFTP